MQFTHWFLSMSGESPTEETAQNQSAFLSPPPQVSQPGSPCMGNFYISASPQGTAISDKCKETVALLQYSLWQFCLKPTFLSLISILQGNYKEKGMVRCGKREAGRTGLGIASGVEQGCSPTPGCFLHWGSRDGSLKCDKPVLATPAAAHPASCALTRTPPAAHGTAAAFWANSTTAHRTGSFNWCCLFLKNIWV